MFWSDIGSELLGDIFHRFTQVTCHWLQDVLDTGTFAKGDPRKAVDREVPSTAGSHLADEAEYD